MLLTLACLFAAAAAAPAPATYDQRQDGEMNVAADIQNVVFFIAYPKKLSNSLGILDLFKSNAPHSRNSDLQERADHVMEAFVEPNTPYRVEIGSGDRSADGDGRAVEVVIAGRRRMGPEPQNEDDSEEYKLIGATEQCGPDRERDPVTLTCRSRAAPAPEPEPEKEQKVVPEPTPEVVPS